ncbi:MAG TPA: ABC transporter permease [Phycisphaerales bacterium]|nr:ABC transporter permease [Phycisphaerales bacterium]
MVLPTGGARYTPPVTKGPGVGQRLLLAGVLAFFGFALLYPIWLMVRGGFAADPVTGTGFTLAHVWAVFADPLLREGLVNALRIAGATTALSVALALPLAVLSARCSFPLKGMWNAAVLLPMILPPFVGAVGLRAVLGRSGALNAALGTEFDFLGGAKFWAVVAIEALHLYPIIYLNAAAALANLDPALDEAGESVGAGRVRRFLTITLPLIRPGLFAGGTIVFIWSFTELGTPLMLDFYAVTPVQIFNGLKEMQTSARPYALSVVMLGMAIAMYALGRLVFGGRAYAMYAKASRAAAERPLTGLAGVAATLAFGLVTLLAVAPHVGVVLTSVAAEGSWYRSVLPREFTLEHFTGAVTHPLAFGAISNSLKLSLMAVALNTGLGLLIGYLIVRTRVRGRALLDALSMLPLAVPGLVLAFGYVAMSLRWPFGAGGPLAGLADVVGANPNPVMLLVLAYSVRRLPYIVRASVAGLEQTSGELEEAAVNLGASRVRTVRTVVVPLIAANLIAGALLAFSFSMLEVSDSMVLAQQERHFPLTKAIYSFSERLGDGAAIASAMGVWGMGLLGVALVGASVLVGKRMGAIFKA